MSGNLKEIKLLDVIKAKNDKQKEFIRMVNEKDFVLVSSIFGTGKTYLTVGTACQLLAEGKIERVIFTRASLHLVQEYGYSTGSYDEKSREYFKQAIRYFHSFLGRPVFEQLWRAGIISLTASEIITGDDYKSSLIVMDECQEADKEDLRDVLTRMSKGSKIIMIGDHGQNKLKDRCFWKRFVDNVHHDNLGKIEFTRLEGCRHSDVYDIVEQLDAL